MRWVLLAFLCSSVAVSHICIFDPPQRGGVDGILVPGDPRCYLRTPTCGGVPAGHPTKAYDGGNKESIHLQQNLNHWFIHKPGRFEISIIDLTNGTGKVYQLAKWADWPAHEMVTQTNFTVEVVIPNINCLKCILAVQYISYNPLEIDPANNTDSIFYNCADIVIRKMAKVPTYRAKKEERPLDPHTCISPKRFHGSGKESTPYGVVDYDLYYDAVVEKVLLLRGNTNWAPSQNSTALTYYKKPSGGEIEYVILGGPCMYYGPNKFYGYEFGPKMTMEFLGKSQLYEEPTFEYRVGPYVKFYATVDKCLPKSVVRLDGVHVYNLTYSSFTFDFPDDVFALPPSCTPHWDSPPDVHHGPQ